MSSAYPIIQTNRKKHPGSENSMLKPVKQCWIRELSSHGLTVFGQTWRSAGMNEDQITKTYQKYFRSEWDNEPGEVVL